MDLCSPWQVRKPCRSYFLLIHAWTRGRQYKKKRNKFPSNRWRWPPLSQTDSRRVMHVIHVLMIGTFRSVDPLMSHYGGLVFIHHRRGRILLLFSFCAFKSRASHIFFFFVGCLGLSLVFPHQLTGGWKKEENLSVAVPPARRVFYLNIFFSLSLSLSALCVRGSLFSVWQERKEEDRLIVHRLLPRLSCVEAFFSPFLFLFFISQEAC